MSGIGDKAKDALGSDAGEKASDSALDKAGDTVNSATGGGHEKQVDEAEHAADSKIGR